MGNYLNLLKLHGMANNDMPMLKSVRKKLLKNGYVKDLNRSTHEEEFWVDCVSNGRDIWYKYNNEEFVENLEVLTTSIRDTHRTMTVDELLTMINESNTSPKAEYTSNDVDRFGYCTANISQAIKHSRLGRTR